MKDDTISRHAAIEAFAPYAEYESNRTNAEWVRRINIVLSSLPSAQPECEDTVPRASVEYICRKNTVSTNPYEHKYHDKFIQFMDDPEISDFGRWQHSNGFNTALVAVLCDLDKVPSVTKEIPRKPIEKRIENGDQTQVFDVCPICGSPDIDKECGDYCPKCGQKIDWEVIR